MKAIEALTSVLCDPEGKCCIPGSDDDRRLIDSALADLAANAADRAIEGCPELNMGNYDEVGVERLNDWAIRANDEIDRLHALAAGQATAAQADSVQEDAARLLALEAAANQIFNNPPSETSQDVRDVIEWFSGSIRVVLDAARKQGATP